MMRSRSPNEPGDAAPNEPNLVPERTHSWLRRNDRITWGDGERTGSRNPRTVLVPVTMISMGPEVPGSFRVDLGGRPPGPPQRPRVGIDSEKARLSPTLWSKR